jgi:hypothetical protein
MIGPRYIVLDDTPQISRLDCTADEFADALRAPLAMIGVRVVRQRRAGTKPFSQFQAHGLPRRQYDAKANQVARIVDQAINGLPKVLL